MSNEDLAELSPVERLLFIYLWMLADREGRLEDRPKRIKAEALPYDDADVDMMLTNLAAGGFLIRYRADGVAYCQIVNFTKHQVPHHKEVESRIPPPDGMPAVTRHGYDVSAERREGIFNRDGRACLKCGTKEALTIDHIVPLSKGGNNEDENLQTLCHRCNSAKGDATKSYRSESNVATEARSNYKKEPTLNQRRANDGGSCPSDSGFSDSLIPDSGSLIPDSPSLRSGVAPGSATAVAPRKPKPKPLDEPPKSGQAWEAYAGAYRARYGVDPVRNQRSNVLLCQLVDRLGAREAPAVAAFYLRHQKSVYVAGRHPIELLLRDAEAIRTDWMTGRQSTVAAAVQGDRTQQNANVFTKLIEEARSG